MTAVAFTNAPGAYRRYSPRIRRDFGTYFGNPGVVNSHVDYVLTDYNFKSETVRGDRKSAYAYFRHIQHVSEDVPYVSRERWPNGYFDVTYVDHLSRFYPLPYLNPPEYSGALLGNARSQAITGALNKLKGGSVQNGADVGEMRTTANMVASGASRILNAWQGLRKGNFPKFFQSLGLKPKDIASGKSASQIWLEYQYGWMPLISSIHDNAELICDTIDKGQPLDIHVKKVQKFEYATGSIERQRYLESWSSQGMAACGLSATVLNPLFYGANRFGLINPLSVAWELTPFSFVVDWFVPVGNVLEALSATSSLAFAGGYVSTTLHSEFKSRLKDGDMNVQNPGSFVWRDFSFNREPLVDFPLPELYGKRNPFSTTHVGSALALLRQSLGMKQTGKAYHTKKYVAPGSLRRQRIAVIKSGV